MDCSGLIIVAAKIANLAPPGFSEKDWAGYSRRPSGELLRKNLSKFARRVNGGILAAEVEDILLMNGDLLLVDMLRAFFLHLEKIAKNDPGFGIPDGVGQDTVLIDLRLKRR